MNDERPIEKLLRRYARKRREEAGAPPELHPATRRLLQGEVARQHPKSSAEGNRTSAVSFFALLAKRWIYAVGVFVVLGVTAIVLLPSLKTDNRGSLAQKEAESLAVRESLAPATTTAATPPAEAQPGKLALSPSQRNQPVSEPSGGGNFVRLRDESTALSFSVTNTAARSPSRLAQATSDSEADSSRKTEESKRFSLGASLDSAAPATRNLSVQSPARSAGEPMPSDSLSVARATSGTRDDADRYNEARQVAPPPAAAPAPLVSSTSVQDKNILARGGGLEKDAERVYSQSFANIAAEQLREKAEKAKGETSSAAVLTKFQVQQAGNQVRVVDADGSTYVGEMNTSVAVGGNAGAIGRREAAANRFEDSTRPATQALVGATATGQLSTQKYDWRVEGTNLTLNQNVVFTWNFIATTNHFGTLQLKDASGVLSQESSPLQFPALLNNSSINGRVHLGPAQQIEVNAVPVK